MEQFLTGLFIGFTVTSIASIFVQMAAWRNGVTDGYGYSKEPNCPGYAKAGDYLRRNMAYRWSELREMSSPCDPYPAMQKPRNRTMHGD